MSPRLLFLALILLGSVTAHAQKVPVAPATKAVAPDLLADDLVRFGVIFKRGFYDELIYNVNQKIEAMPAATRDTPDPRLLYFRGLAYFQLGWFPEAKADLTVAQKAGLSFLPGGFGLTYALTGIEEKSPLLPPKVEEIREGERVIFRMHYFGMEGGTVMIAAMLPEAYRISRAMFGSETEATTVYVFDTYEQFVAYYKQVYKGVKPGSWYAATTTGPVIWISLRDTNGVLRAKENREAFKTTVVHEYNHAMLNRLIGRTALPTWFKEGLAQVAGAQVDPADGARKQKTLARLFRNNAVLPIEKLDDSKSFFENTELGVAMGKGDDRDFAPDAYTQGYGMTQYFLSHVSTPQLQSFLNRVRASEDFPNSFQEEFGFSVEQFYQSWKSDVGPQLAAR